MKKLTPSAQVAMETLFTGHGPTTFKGKTHNLRRCQLPGLILYDADMQGAVLSHSDMQRAELPSAKLCKVALDSVNLAGAHLVGADLRGADLSRADLSGANLKRADLRGANLYQTNLQCALLDDAKLDDDAVSQLSEVKTLFAASGIPRAMGTELQRRRRNLFRDISAMTANSDILGNAPSD